jgi:hypothetical protein
MSADEPIRRIAIVETGVIGGHMGRLVPGTWSRSDRLKPSRLMENLAVL